jgi:hypothetical protein
MNGLTPGGTARHGTLRTVRQGMAGQRNGRQGKE